MQFSNFKEELLPIIQLCLLGIANPCSRFFHCRIIIHYILYCSQPSPLTPQPSPLAHTNKPSSLSHTNPFTAEPLTRTSQSTAAPSPPQALGIARRHGYVTKNIFGGGGNMFLFPAKGKGSTVLDGNAARSAEWFFGELKGGRGGAGLRRRFSDPNSVNCLLGLEESGGGDGNSKGEEGEAKRGSGEGKLTKNSVPGSPIVEMATSSSFGSSNSSPSLANLAPIRTHVEGGGGVGERVRVSDQRIGEIDEQFSQLNVNGSKHDEDLVVMPSTVVTPVAVTGDVAVGVAAASPGASGVGGNVNGVVASMERSDQDVASGTEDQPVMVSPQSQQKLSGCYDLPSPDSVSRKLFVVASLLVHISKLIQRIHICFISNLFMSVLRRIQKDSNLFMWLSISVF
ncbi:hypothetical protein Droror1_Dr00014769 [Drosera rotundifolia]